MGFYNINILEISNKQKKRRYMLNIPGKENNIYEGKRSLRILGTSNRLL